MVKPDSLPNIAYYLTVSGLDSTEVLLDSRSTTWPSTHDSPGGRVRAFRRRLRRVQAEGDSCGFTYDPESERALKQLKMIVEFEGYYDDARPNSRLWRRS